jgi:hypothetical protein
MPRRSRLAVALGLALLSGFQGSAEPSPPEGYFGSYVWRVAEKAFGGLSAVEMVEDGQSFVVLGDKSMFLRGTLRRDGAGRVVEVIAGPILPLRAESTGEPLVGRRADSEGLAIGPDGQAFVSFENRSRVASLDLETGLTRDLDPHPDFASLPRNGALEALAIGPDLRLYTIPEDPLGGQIPLYRWDNGVWDDKLSVPRRGHFLPVAADVGPDGRIYILERDFRALGGFSSRLRRFDLGADGLTGEAILLETPFSMHDNLEGLSVWRDDQGVLHATMISDDNFIFVQQTQIVEYRLLD